MEPKTQQLQMVVGWWWWLGIIFFLFLFYKEGIEIERQAFAMGKSFFGNCDKFSVKDLSEGKRKNVENERIRENKREF